MNQDMRNQQIRVIDEFSTALIRAGVNVIKRNPIPVGSYILGILICFCCTGFKVSLDQQKKYNNRVAGIDYAALDKAAMELDYAQDDYRRSKGWFSCDKVCQIYKKTLSEKQFQYNELERGIKKEMSNAKAGVGIFSEYGVSETRELFWRRFTQGKSFAQRQSTWDALFMGLSAMGRDESMLSYLMRLLLSVLFNFTVGMVGAVVAFIFNLYGLITAYQVPIYYAITFFILASLAAISFAVTWIIGIYAVAAGAVFVGAKAIAANMRIEGGNMGSARPAVHSQQRRRE